MPLLPIQCDISRYHDSKSYGTLLASSRCIYNQRMHGKV
uniref:Uncharacterized protein n=1 Tax=Arundo donax TaxID=35708 RepID=A0A0A9G802_ARUDO